MAACVQREQEALTRTIALIDASEAQRSSATDPALRRDAERALETLVQRAAEIRRRLRVCVEEPAAPVRVVEREAADPAAEAVGQAGHSLSTVEADVELASEVRVVRAEQVDGAGRMQLADVRAAMRRIATQLQRCYESHVRRGSRELDLVFTVRTAGRASAVEVERTAGADVPLEQCVRQAGRALAVQRGPSGGEAVFSYRLRFGR